MDRVSEIERIVKRMDNKLTMLLNRPKSETWVRAGIITDLTGWKGSRLTEAREKKHIEYRVVGSTSGKFEYNIESISPIFLKQHI